MQFYIPAPQTGEVLILAAHTDAVFYPALLTGTVLFPAPQTGAILLPAPQTRAVFIPAPHTGTDLITAPLYIDFRQHWNNCKNYIYCLVLTPQTGSCQVNIFTPDIYSIIFTTTTILILSI